MNARHAIVAALAAITLSSEPFAVQLRPEGQGQALIYPYYTVRSAGGNAFNTYLSVTNHTADAKALRVRFREGRNGREVLAFNLYLSPNDAWAAAVVPTETGTRLLTVDRSCTDPAIVESGQGIDFGTTSFTGVNADGSGDTPDRTREGFIEILEMARLAGASATAVTQRSDGIPASCSTIRAGAPAVSAPGGGLSGTLTLINVTSGLDFTLPADALAELTQAAFFRAPVDPYPDFNAAEVTPVSAVLHDGFVYRSEWNRGVDAVSAVLMRSAWSGEYVLDESTASRTDVVVTLPTRHHYTISGTAAPFTRTARWSGYQCPGGGEEIQFRAANREAFLFPPECTITPCAPPPGGNSVCASAAVGTVVNARIGPSQPAAGPSALFGSTTGSLMSGTMGGFDNGWIKLAAGGTGNVLTSLPSSTRIHVRTGAVEGGAHRFTGLPVTGFTARLFNNGTLDCAGAACQGNYGGAFPLAYERSITR